MQRDSAWHGVRHLTDLDAPEEIGRLAGERAVARLNPAKPKAGPLSGAVRPARGRIAARPFRRRDHRLFGRPQVLLPPGEAGAADLRARAAHHRRPAPPPRPSLAPVRQRGLAGLADGPDRGRDTQDLDRRERIRPAARHPAHRARRPRRRRASRRGPEQSVHRSRAAKPRRTARRLSRSRARDRADRPGREWRNRRLQPGRGRLHGPRRSHRGADCRDHHRLQPARHVRDARAGQRPRVPPRRGRPRLCSFRK